MCESPIDYHKANTRYTGLCSRDDSGAELGAVTFWLIAQSVSELGSLAPHPGYGLVVFPVKTESREGGFQTRPYEDAASFYALGVTNSLLVHECLHALHYFRRLRHDLFRQRFKIFTAGWCNVEVFSFRFRQKLGILHGFKKRFTQDFHPIGRCPRRRDDRPAEIRRGQYHRH